MLFSPFSTPRRAIVLATFVSCAIFFLASQWRHPATSYGFPVTRPSVEDATSTGPLQDTTGPEQNTQKSPGNVAGEETHITTATDLTATIKAQPTPSTTTGSLDKLVSPIKHLSYASLQEKIKALIQWTPLDTPLHWPSWNGYRNEDYDPNRWEGFTWENGYFIHNGIKRLEEQTGLKPEPYLPYPKYNTEEWKEQWKGEYVSCQSARGKDLDTSVDDMVYAYKAMPEDFPNATVGSIDATGLDETTCFERYHRYGPYGFGQSGISSPESWRKPMDRPDWSSVRWGQLQDACLQRNNDRYAREARAPMVLQPAREMPQHSGSLKDTEPASASGAVAPRFHSRTALLIRTWQGYDYSDNDLQAIRALITELSLLSGGEYQVYLFVNVKENADIYGDPQVYQDVLRRVVPRELRDISILWTEQVCEEWYPKVGDWQVYWHQFMPLQWFSKTHPEFDFVWNWETDARYTGNHYHFLERMADFARNTPRKHLWERNARFYFPSAHGNYASFLADTDAAIETATSSGSMTPVWGAQPYASTQIPLGPEAPLASSASASTWGIGEEADLITLQPIWDPVHTSWSYRDKIWNFLPGVHPVFTASDPVDTHYTHANFSRIPRRTFINTVARFSARMLHAMHAENLAGRSMQAEMWPATVALQHGLKAVYAPHPIWTDRAWPPWYLDAVFNADGGEAAAWGQRANSPYNHDREAQFRGWSWYYAAGFPRVLYRRWLGWKALDVLGDLGGSAYEDEETTLAWMDEGGEVDDSFDFGGRGRMCLPGMLLHPVKKVREDDGVVGHEITRARREDRETERRITEEVEMELRAML